MTTSVVYGNFSSSKMMAQRLHHPLLPQWATSLWPQCGLHASFRSHSSLPLRFGVRTRLATARHRAFFDLVGYAGPAAPYERP